MSSPVATVPMAAPVSTRVSSPPSRKDAAKHPSTAHPRTLLHWFHESPKACGDDARSSVPDTWKKSTSFASVDAVCRWRESWAKSSDATGPECLRQTAWRMYWSPTDA